MLCVYFLLSIPRTWGENLLQNPDFASQEGWKLQTRTSMWSVEPAKENEVHFDVCETCGSKRAVVFEELTKPKEAYLVSQYISEEKIKNSEGGNLGRIKFDLENIKSVGKYTFHLDVSYVNQSYLHLENEIDAERYEKSCFLVPAYSAIRSMMVHIVVNNQMADRITIKGVSLSILEDISKYSHCHVSLDHKPKNRLVLHEYLKPLTAPAESKITLVSQFTVDRLDLFEASVKKWKGPATAVILVFDDEWESTLQIIHKAYEKSKALSKYATIHIVKEDFKMKRDRFIYPVNFLRRVGLNATTTDYVFYVDADIIPSFNHNKGLEWISKAKHLTHERSAFVVPIFNSKDTNPEIPASKKSLLAKIDEKILEPFFGVSHAVVQYQTWYKAKHLYEIKYRENMEPYFITHREAPLINEMFEGYGRDKCAYSRELHHAEFTFHVLPYAFMINRKDRDISNTIIRRRPGVALQVFLNSMFHEEDLKRGFFRRRPEPPPEIEAEPEEEMFCDAVTGKCGPPHHGESMYTEEANINMDKFFDYYNNDDKDTEGLGCFQLREMPQPIQLQDDMLHTLQGMELHPDRAYTAAETVIKTMGIGHFIYLPKKLHSMMNLMLPFSHPKVVINVVPKEYKVWLQGADKSSLYEEYQSSKNTSDILLRKVRTKYMDPVIYWMAIDGLSSHSAITNLTAVLEYSTNKDVIIIEKANLSATDLVQEMCAMKRSWKLFKSNQYYIMKSSFFDPPHPLQPFPLSVESLHVTEGHINLPRCPAIKTDVVLFTRNRPLQTHAFIEGLLQMVSGVNKLWVVSHTDGDKFKTGYENVHKCFKKRINMEVISDNKEGFGKVFDDILHNSVADYILMAVDEILWLRPVDLTKITCLMYHLQDQIFTFQLRLGDNVLPQTKFNDQKVLIGELDGEKIYGLYPLWLPYDYGYVTQVDAPLISKKQLHEEIGSWVYSTKHPGEIESRWLRQHLHKHARNWHLIYEKSRFVNNLLSDGRVTNTKLSEKHYELNDKYLIENLTTDIDTFRKENENHQATHISRPVKFREATCFH